MALLHMATPKRATKAYRISTLLCGHVTTYPDLTSEIWDFWYQGRHYHQTTSSITLSFDLISSNWSQELRWSGEKLLDNSWRVAKGRDLLLDISSVRIRDRGWIQICWSVKVSIRFELKQQQVDIRSKVTNKHHTKSGFLRPQTQKNSMPNYIHSIARYGNSPLHGEPVIWYHYHRHCWRAGSETSLGLLVMLDCSIPSPHPKREHPLSCSSTLLEVFRRKFERIWGEWLHLALLQSRGEECGR